MKRSSLFICILLFAISIQAQELTLQQCQELAKKNYPLIAQYDLIERSTQFTIANTRKANLPKIVFDGQATYQSAVPDFPEQMKQIFSKIVDMEGLNKDQYKMALEVNQTVWNGGKTRVKEKMQEAEKRVELKNVDVELYGLQNRINELFFGILLIEENMVQNRIVSEVLDYNYKRIQSYVVNGTALQSDLDMIAAQRLTVEQEYITLASVRTSYKQMLALFIGKNTKEGLELVKPSPLQFTSLTVLRPELEWYDAQISRLDWEKKSVKSSLKPYMGVFASGYYGNPGLNFLKDMVHSQWSWNYMAGVKLQWNFSEFYTKRNALRKIEIAQSQIENRKDVFLFNTRLVTVQQQDNISRLQRLIANDEEIIRLRISVRRAAESKMTNGIIDVTDLLQKIADENSALTTKSAHGIELLKAMYELKTTINN